MAKKEKRVLFWRIMLGVLIVCNMIAIFLFSSQNALKSALLSQKVTVNFIEMIPKDFFDRFTEAPQEIVTTPPELPEPPESTTPVGTEPAETTPIPGPEETKPTETKPVETKPTETKPVETKPVETKPVETTPAVTTPEETTPEETTPEETTTEETTTEEPENPLDGLTDEQIALVNKMHTPVRKLAHMLEFGCLATLVFLFLVTWSGKLWWRYFVSLGFTLLYAASDELHQLFRDGRGSQLKDVMIDFTGAFIACTTALVVVVIIRLIKHVVLGKKITKENIVALMQRIKQIFFRIKDFISLQIEKIKTLKKGKDNKKKEKEENKKEK